MEVQTGTMTELAYLNTPSSGSTFNCCVCLSDDFIAILEGLVKKDDRRQRRKARMLRLNMRKKRGQK